jgi:hypothetical protein
MDAELKAKWIAALRSGEYEQGKGNLRARNGTYCCLGVLCKVAGYGIDTDNDCALRPDGTKGEQSYDALDDLGAVPKIRHPLISMNDSDSTFTEIADYIEANIPVTTRDGETGHG